MPSETNHPVGASSQPALELIALAKLSPDDARKNLRALLLSNPKYFGGLTVDSIRTVLKIQEDTSYESLGAVGYDQQLEELRATIKINQDKGYSGKVHWAGSEEYIRFFLSYDNGATWEDQGMKDLNVVDGLGPKPLRLVVNLAIKPRKDCCLILNTPRVRAILSWNTAPPAEEPNWLPVWGNVAETTIQVMSPHFTQLCSLLPMSSEAGIAEQMMGSFGVDRSTGHDSRRLSPFDLHMLYASTDVPEHRYLASLLTRAATVSEGLATRQGITSKPMLTFMPDHEASRLDLFSLVDRWLSTNADAAYEQLECVDLDPAAGRLTAVIRVKQGRGYSGGPCTAGSTEHVAFWIDSGSGWKYAGTASVNVHDFGPLPEGGLQYSVSLPIDLSSCGPLHVDAPWAVAIRAVLSWNSAPSSVDPEEEAVWGDRVDGLALIGSRRGANSKPQTSRMDDFDSSGCNAQDSGARAGIIPAAIAAQFA
jgi:hypothetical protein